MATFQKVNDFVEHLAEKKHNLGADQIAVALSDTAPGSETNNPTEDGNGVLANVTEIAYTNLSGSNPRNVTTNSSSQTGGTYSLVLADLTLQASGGSVGPFRYVYVYNEDAASDELIGYYDYGESLTLSDGDSFDIDFDNVNGLLQLS